MEEDLELNNEEEQTHEGGVKVCFSKEDKARMRATWQKALIIKTFGRRMGFTFLIKKIRNMWKLTRGNGLN